MTNESFKILTAIGSAWYEQGLYLAEVVMYSAMLEYSLEPDQLINVYNLRSEDYEALGHYDLAIDDYLHILDLGDRRAGFLNRLCWNYDITNQAENALPYCEEAVEKDPSAQTLDSRAVAYAMLGRYDEAISDFEAALEQDGWPDEDMKSQRQEWVTSLKAGSNPITEQVLANERLEESSLTTDPEYTGDLKVNYLRQQYEDMGYVLEAGTFDGQEGVMGVLQEGDCKSEIVLLGNEDEFNGGTSTITNCSHDDLSSHAWEFTLAFAKDMSEMGRVLVWASADYYYVIEGKPITDLTPTFGGFQFTVERLSEAGQDGILVTAKPAE